MCNRKSGGWATCMWLEQFKGGGGWDGGDGGWLGGGSISAVVTGDRRGSESADTEEERVGAAVLSRCIHRGPNRRAVCTHRLASGRLLCLFCKKGI